VNNYLFGQDIFSADDTQNDVMLADYITTALQDDDRPSFLHDRTDWMSDILLKCRRTRSDIHLIKDICEGRHTYGSLVKACSIYL
jgi:hypothetical protein